MSALSSRVQVRNIRDAEAFVQRAISRAWVIQPNSPEERADIVAEGLCLLLELSERFEEHRPGYEHPGSFSLYATKYLPLRLADAWAKMRREHRFGKDADGRRFVEFGEPALSLNVGVEQAATQSEGGAPLHNRCTGYADGWLAVHDPEPDTPVASGWSPPARVHDAMLTAWPATSIDRARGVLATMQDGYTVAETALLLGMRRGEVDEIRATVASALVHLEGEPRWVRRSVIASYALAVEQERVA